MRLSVLFLMPGKALRWVWITVPCFHASRAAFPTLFIDGVDNDDKQVFFCEIDLLQVIVVIGAQIDHGPDSVRVSVAANPDLPHPAAIGLDLRGQIFSGNGCREITDDPGSSLFNAKNFWGMKIGQGELDHLAAARVIVEDNGLQNCFFDSDLRGRCCTGRHLCLRGWRSRF